MGIYDRDWYKDKKEQDKAKDSLYDPKQFRRQKNAGGDSYDPLQDLADGPKKRPPNFIRSAGTWLLLVLGLALLFHYVPHIEGSRNESRKAELPRTPSLMAGNTSQSLFSSGERRHPDCRPLTHATD